MLFPHHSTSSTMFHDKDGIIWAINSPFLSPIIRWSVLAVVPRFLDAFLSGFLSRDLGMFYFLPQVEVNCLAPFKVFDYNSPSVSYNNFIFQSQAM